MKQNVGSAPISFEFRAAAFSLVATAPPMPDMVNHEEVVRENPPRHGRSERTELDELRRVAETVSTAAACDGASLMSSAEFASLLRRVRSTTRGEV
jgi:hypothetical protein